MAELSGRAGDWLGWRRTIDFTLRGQASGEGAGVLRRWREEESGAGLAWAGSQRGGARAQAGASLRPGAWGTEVTRSREPVVTAGVGGVPCARVRGSGLGLWGSWTRPPAPGCQEQAWGQPQRSCIGNRQGRLSYIKSGACTHRGIV